LAAIETTKKLERLKSYVRAVPAHHGVNAPSGIDLDAYVEGGLAVWCTNEIQHP
jgi:hypothetical protein